MLRLYGGVGPGDVLASDVVCEPDLAGITEMIRMVSYCFFFLFNVIISLKK